MFQISDRCFSHNPKLVSKEDNEIRIAAPSLEEVEEHLFSIPLYGTRAQVDSL